MTKEALLAEHFWLSQGMARSVGVKLNEALQAGNVKRVDYEAALVQCCLCSSKNKCKAWLAVAHGPSENAPDFCALSGLLAAAKV